MARSFESPVSLHPFPIPIITDNSFEPSGEPILKHYFFNVENEKRNEINQYVVEK